MAGHLRHDRIKRLMEERGFTAGQVAYRADVSEAHIYRVVSGERPNASGNTLAEIATALGTTTDYLLGLTSNPRRPENTTTPQTELEWQLLEKFRDLSFDEQRYIIAQLDLALDIFSRPAYRVIGGEDDDEAQEPRSDKGTNQPPPST